MIALEKNYQIIDCHIHLGYDAGTGERTTVKDLECLSLKHGIDKFLASSFKAQNYDFVEGNEDILKISQGHELITPIAVINPIHGKRAIKEVEECAKKGFVGVKLNSAFIYFDMYGYDSSMVDDVVRKADEYGLVVFLEKIDAGRFANLSKKCTQSILVRLGGSWMDMYSLKGAENILWTVAPGFPDSIKMAVDTVGIEKLVFGSNYPYQDYAHILELFEESSLTQEEKKKIFHENILNIFKKKDDY